MIRPDIRARLTPRDFEVVLLTLAHGEAAAYRRLEARLFEEGPDALLDAPELPARLRALRGVLVPSEALFLYVMVRHALLAADVDDRELADYLAALVAEFGRRDRAWRVDWHDDATHRYVVDLLADLERSDGPRRFRVVVHLGNWALWLGGLFPRHVEARRDRRGGPDIGYYDRMGRRGFAEASGHALAGTLGLASVFGTAAERYPAVRGALNRLAAEVFFAPRAA